MNKEENLILIAVRLKSKRLKKKALLPLNNVPLIVILTERLKRAKKANKVIWCTTINSEDDELEYQANKYGVYCYRGSELDVLSRFIEVAEKFKSKNIVRVTGDNPLTDPEIIDYLLQKHDESLAEYTYCDNIPVGSRSEIIS